MQQRALSEVAEALYSTGYRLEVETNGTLEPIPTLQRVIAQWNVSPKLANSGNSACQRQVGKPLRWFSASEQAWFKFVVETPSDLDEIDLLVAKYEIPEKRVILMPQGTSPDAIQRRSDWLGETCVRRGYKFSSRLHILLWGDERGR